MRQDFISVSVLSEYLYCPRSCGYQVNQFSPQQEGNFFILDGRNKHFKSVHSPSFFNRRGERVLTQFLVFSRRHSLIGRLDRLEIQSEAGGKVQVNILEEKRGLVRSDEKITFQLELLTLCYAEMFPEHSVSSAIYFIDSRRRIPIDYNPEKIEQKVNSVMVEIQKSNFPAKRDARCQGCMYHKLCG